VSISVDSVWPLYGPVSGGTRVTITGQFLSASIVTAVYFGQYRRQPDTNRLSSLLFFCSEVEQRAMQALVLLRSGCLSVCPSVCPSVIFLYCIKTNKWFLHRRSGRIHLFLPYHTIHPGILKSLQSSPPSEGVNGDFCKYRLAIFHL